jgi:hypothetical protein
MRKAFAVLALVLTLTTMAAVAHAERGDIGGIGTMENGSIWPFRPGTRSIDRPILPW